MIDGLPMVADNWSTALTTTITTEAKMLLSGDEIRQRLGNGLVIDPFDPEIHCGLARLLARRLAPESAREMYVCERLKKEQ